MLEVRRIGRSHAAPPPIETGSRAGTDATTRGAGGAPTANRRFVKTVKNATRAAARASRASAKASAAGGAARQKGAFQRFGEWLHGKG